MSSIFADTAGELTKDPEGQDFETLEDAIAEAEASAREIMADSLRSNEPIEIDNVIDIADEHGIVVASVSFRSTIKW
jgi:hypothetical protein